MARAEAPVACAVTPVFSLTSAGDEHAPASATAVSRSRGRSGIGFLRAGARTPPMSKSPELIQPDRGQAATLINLVNKDGYAAWAKRLTTGQRAALEGQKFDGGPYQVGVVPDGDGWFAVGGVADPASLSSWCLAKLAEALPAGIYRLADGDPGPALFGWQTAQYRFTRYREDKDATGARVLLTGDAKAIEPALAEARAAMKVMDLVNTSPEDMGPAALEAEAEALAKAHKAQLSVTKGEALEREYPM